MGAANLRGTVEVVRAKTEGRDEASDARIAGVGAVKEGAARSAALVRGANAQEVRQSDQGQQAKVELADELSRQRSRRSVRRTFFSAAASTGASSPIVDDVSSDFSSDARTCLCGPGGWEVTGIGMSPIVEEGLARR